MLKNSQKNPLRILVFMLAIVWMTATWVHRSHSHDEHEHKSFSSECSLCLSSLQFHAKPSLCLASSKFIPSYQTEGVENTPLAYLKSFWHFSSIRGPPVLSIRDSLSLSHLSS